MPLSLRSLLDVRRSLLPGFVFTPLVAAMPLSVLAAQQEAMTPERWRTDLGVLRDRLPAAHIDLFHMTSEAEFHARIDSLVVAADTASREQMLIGIARITASVGEGHTSARILRPDMAAFPLLTQVQEDGLFIRQIGRSRERLLGGLVVSVEGRPTAEVLRHISGVISADNRMGTWAWLPYYLATEDVLRGLGLLDATPGLGLEILRVDGIPERTVIEARPLPEVEQLFSPRSASMASVSSLRPALVRQRHAGAYWFEWLPEHRMMFARIDRLVSQQNWPFTAFVDSLFAEIDRLDADRLVLDLRSASGGNHISLPLVHALVRRERFARRGHLFVLIGRGTFSAGQNLVTLLEQHVQPIFVGEPTAGRPNSYGVLGSFRLPHSGLEIRYSRFFIQDSDPADYRHWQEPHIRVPLSVRAEMTGRDVALEAALRFDRRFPWDDLWSVVLDVHGRDGTTAAIAFARMRIEELRAGGWVVARALDQLGYGHLREGRTADAIALFRFGAELHPRDFNAWDSLGEALVAAGDAEHAVAAYERSLALNGYNDNARRWLRVLALDGR